MSEQCECMRCRYTRAMANQGLPPAEPLPPPCAVYPECRFECTWPACVGDGPCTGPQ